jgi:predicted CxxxxCH...CXXCH cytochrome family protein
MKPKLITLLFCLCMGTGLYFAGCSKPTSEEEGNVSLHPSDWMTLSSNGYHGAVVIADNFNLENCQGCHRTIQGSDTTWSCWTCHVEYPHKASINPYSGSTKHGGIIRQINYQVWVCNNCHGTPTDKYSGGVADSSCIACHEWPNGPEACNTCHGDMYLSSADTVNWAPPPDLLGNTDSTLMTVGVHKWHVKPQGITGQQVIGGPYSCRECHQVFPAQVAPNVHPNPDYNTVSVVFGPLASLDAPEDDVTPVFNPTSGTCTSTYCHNPGEIGNPDNPAPVWNLPDSTQVACGTCHLMPPPPPHEEESECWDCHSGVVNSSLQIIAPDQHVNGEVDF